MKFEVHSLRCHMIEARYQCHIIRKYCNMIKIQKCKRLASMHFRNGREFRSPCSHAGLPAGSPSLHLGGRSSNSTVDVHRSITQHQARNQDPQGVERHKVAPKVERLRAGMDKALQVAGSIVKNVPINLAN